MHFFNGNYSVFGICKVNESIVTFHDYLSDGPVLLEGLFKVFSGNASVDAADVDLRGLRSASVATTLVSWVAIAALAVMVASAVVIGVGTTAGARLALGSTRAFVVNSFAGVCSVEFSIWLLSDIVVTGFRVLVVLSS